MIPKRVLDAAPLWHSFLWTLAAICVPLNGVQPILAATHDSGEDKAEMPHVVKEIGAGFEIPDAPAVLRHNLIGRGHPITYRFQVEPDAEYEVGLAFFENFYSRPGHRVVQIEVEGAEPIRCDLARQAGYKTPFLTHATGHDENDDGWLSLTVGSHADAKDRNPSLGAVWLFDRRDWPDEGMEADSILRGKHNSKALYHVNCGAEGSKQIERTLQVRVKEARSRLTGLRAIMSRHEKLGLNLNGTLAPLEGRIDQFALLLSERKLYKAHQVYRQIDETLDEVAEMAERNLVEHHKPDLRQPAQTHLSSPWGAVIRLRQEDTLGVQFDVLPRPESQKHRYHPRYAAKDPWGWISVAADTPSQQDSTALGLPYNLGLERIEYDPIVTRYVYEKGEIAVRVMDKAALRVVADDFSVHVSLQRDILAYENDLIFATMDTVDDIQFYAGIVFRDVSAGAAWSALESANVTCNGFTILWADTKEELHSLARHMSDWVASHQDAKNWADKATHAPALKGKGPLVERAPLDQRTLLSAGQKFGGFPAALDAGYEAIWIRDTTIIAACAAWTGNPEYLRRWAPYVIANPTPAEIEGKQYDTFIIAPYDDRHIFKMEDDGPFYAILSAYGYWKLLDDPSRLAEWYPVLDSSMRFLNVKSYDPEIGLYSEALINEAPLKDSPYWQDEKVEGLKIGDDWPWRLHSLYVNHLMYASHLMMAEIAEHLGKKEAVTHHLSRARQVAETVDQKLWDSEKGMYHAGLAVMDEGRLVPVDWTYVSFDYVWAVCLYPMVPNPERSYVSMNAMMHDGPGPFPAHGGRIHMASAVSHAASVYNWIGDHAQAKNCLEFLVDHAQKVDFNDALQAIYMMPGSIPEWTTIIKFHRPQFFAVAPTLQAVASLAVLVDFNGVSLVGNDPIHTVEGIRFRDAVVNADLTDIDNAAGIEVDGQRFIGTLRIPVKALSSGTHEVRVIPAEGTTGPASPLLLHTNMELLDWHADSERSWRYGLTGYGMAYVRFRSLDNTEVQVRDASGQTMPVHRWSTDHGDCLAFALEGEPVSLHIRRQ